jgi:predicted alpha/beta hydrolase
MCDSSGEMADPQARRRATSKGSLGRWKKAPAAPGVASEAGGAGRVEEVEIRTKDGWALRAGVCEPMSGASGAGGRARGVAVLAHALMARRSEFHRADGGLAGFLAARGWRVVSFDFRGHGESSPRADQGGRYAYDDLVRSDLPAVVSFARSRARGRLGRLPVVVVGHSLGGHTSLAAQATGGIHVDALVGFGACPWVRDLEPSASRWVAKRALVAGMVAMARRVGRLPARALRRGSDDESLACMEDIGRFARAGWASADGRHDYLSAIGRVRVPVLQVVSSGDRLECAPACGAALLEGCGGRGARDLVRIEGSDGGGKPPGHMGMVTSQRLKDAWTRVEEWMGMYA